MPAHVRHRSERIFKTMDRRASKKIALSSHIVPPLLAWYWKNARPLPWRADMTPYRVWLSEVMSQQTRIDTLIPYYGRFLSALPTIRDLAQADDETLFKLWEGLGYYSRARNLRAAARVIEQRHGGVFPREHAEILKLPGVGPYTAGAIASVCFGAKTPAIDGNALRVVARLAEYPGDISSAATKKIVARALADIYPDDAPGDFTQAVMELGATVCVPTGAPKCELCPLSADCLAHRNGTAARYPIKPLKSPRKIVEMTVLLLCRRNCIAIRKREETGLLAGLWELPNIPEGIDAQRARNVARTWGVDPVEVASPFTRKHIFTHIEWRMTCYVVACRGVSERFDWATADELRERYALPTAFRRCLTGAHQAAELSSSCEFRYFE